MLEEILRHLKNYFVVKDGVHSGSFTISSGALQSVTFLSDNQYFRIVGSKFNDGVYKYPATGLADEQFSGEVWAMAVPPAVIALSSDIASFCSANPVTPFMSESFGGYSYSRGANAAGAAAGWQDVFRSQLNAWRKL